MGCSTNNFKALKDDNHNILNSNKQLINSTKAIS